MEGKQLSPDPFAAPAAHRARRGVYLNELC